MQLYFSVFFTISYSSPSYFLWLHGPLELWKRNDQSCLFIMHLDSKIIFLPMFHSHHLYLFRRENESWIVYSYFALQKKNGFINILPTLVNIAHRDNHKRVTGCVPLLDQNLPNIWGGSDQLAARFRRASGLTGTTSCFMQRHSPMSVLSWGGGENDFLPW